MSNRSISKALSTRQHHWLEHLVRCANSGTPLKASADANDLSVSALYTARRNLKALGAGPQQPPGVAPSPQFVAVKVERPVQVMGLLVRLPNGVVVEATQESVCPTRVRRWCGH